MHAAFRFASDWRHTMHKWMDESEYICVLAAENEDHLKKLLKSAGELQIPHASFNEPDFDNSLTAIALGPGLESKKLCSNLKLALRDKL